MSIWRELDWDEVQEQWGLSHSDVDDILERWLAGEDVSDDAVWSHWDEKYAIYEDEEDDDGLDSA